LSRTIGAAWWLYGSVQRLERMGGLHRSDGGQRPAMCTPVGPAAARPGPAFRPPRAPQRSRESGAEVWVFRACHVREQAGCRFCRGGVVRKARLPFHYRHDTRRFVGQIDLIRQQCVFHRGLGWFASRLLAGRLLLRLARRRAPRFQALRRRQRLGKTRPLKSTGPMLKSNPPRTSAVSSMPRMWPRSP
jgi:hypothetical protein